MRQPGLIWQGKKRGFSAITALLVLSLVAFVGTPDVAAQESEGGEEQQATKRTGSMSEKTYKKLAEAQELADAEDFNGARRILDELKASPKLSPYEQAQLYNFYGFIYYAQEDYKQQYRLLPEGAGTA